MLNFFHRTMRTGAIRGLLARKACLAYKVPKARKARAGPQVLEGLEGFKEIKVFGGRREHVAFEDFAVLRDCAVWLDPKARKESKAPMVLKV